MAVILLAHFGKAKPMTSAIGCTTKCITKETKGWKWLKHQAKDPLKTNGLWTSANC